MRACTHTHKHTYAQKQHAPTFPFSVFQPSARLQFWSTVVSEPVTSSAHLPSWGTLHNTSGAAAAQHHHLPHRHCAQRPGWLWPQLVWHADRQQHHVLAASSPRGHLEAGEPAGYGALLWGSVLHGKRRHFVPLPPAAHHDGNWWEALWSQYLYLFCTLSLCVCVCVRWGVGGAWIGWNSSGFCIAGSSAAAAIACMCVCVFVWYGTCRPVYSYSLVVFCMPKFSAYKFLFYFKQSSIFLDRFCKISFVFQSGICPVFCF